MGKNDWILDVLADLKTFASNNELFAISEQLNDAMLIAVSELASQKQEVCAPDYGTAKPIEPDFGSSGCHEHA